MRKTPDRISKTRQKLSWEIGKWKKSLSTVESRLSFSPGQQAEREALIVFHRIQIKELTQKLHSTIRSGRKRFWV